MTQQDWIREGLRVLREEGDQGLTIEVLCRRLERTKGSFYHHFSGRESFVRELLAYWEEVFTADVIRDLAAFDTPHGRLRELSRRTVRHIDSRLERSIRIWGERDPIARVTVDRVDRAREGYLRQQFELASGAPDDAAVAARAQLAILVGIQMLYQDSSKEELQRLVDHHHLGPRPPQTSTEQEESS